MLEYYWLIVAVVALVYSAAARFAQFKFGNQKKMKKFQEKMKELNKDYREAVKNKNDSRADAILKKQQEVFPEMGKMMVSQFKIMGLILILFFGFMAVLNAFDPFTNDDIIVSLVDDGTNCDELQGDSIYSGCYTFDNDNYGAWLATANVYDGDILGNPSYQASKRLIYEEGTTEFLIDQNKSQERLDFNLDKETYNKGDEMLLTAKFEGNPQKVEAKLTNGTWFHFILPFSIPLIFMELTVLDLYGYFIIIAIFSGLILTQVYKRVFDTKEEPKEEGETPQ